MSFDSVKDSGERQQFSTGSQRDSQAGKGRFDLIPFYMLERLAQHFENGSVKYGDNNWKLGQPLSQYANSGLRHAIKAGEGWLDEDHAAAAMWNFGCLMWTLNEIEGGRLPAELNDIHWQTDGPGAPAKPEESEIEAHDIITHHGVAIRTDLVEDMTFNFEIPSAFVLQREIDGVNPALIDILFGEQARTLAEPLIPAECFQVDSEGTVTVPDAGRNEDFFEIAGDVDPDAVPRCKGFCIACGDAWPAPRTYEAGDRVTFGDIARSVRGEFGDLIVEDDDDVVLFCHKEFASSNLKQILDRLEGAGFQVTKA